MMINSVNPVWFISGCSTGFGREIAKAVLARGWRAVVTARDPAALANIVELAPERALACKLDVRNRTDIAAAIEAADNTFGGIDVLVNNAGYGYRASIEEGEETVYRDMFETNLFGVIRLTQAALPIMRRGRSGHIFNIGSISGLMAQPGGGFYAGTKFAVEGITAALAKELVATGIRATVIEPGPFRTDFSGRSIKETPSTIADYADSVGALIRMAGAMDGKQPGDPARASEAIIQAYLTPEAPVHLVLGRLAYDMLEGHLKARLEEVQRWRDVSIGADYPAD